MSCFLLVPIDVAYMYKNFKDDENKGSHLEKLSWESARAYMKEDHNRWMEDLEKGKSAAFERLNVEPKELW